VRDFWSKIIEPLWNILIVLGPSIPKVNDPKSKQMLVMGSFFMIKKYVYEGIGTYNAVIVCRKILHWVIGQGSLATS
jgi:hypothetical protein